VGAAGVTCVGWDGERLTVAPDLAGRIMEIDPRCLHGRAVPGAYAHVCALAGDRARLRFDEPEVQQVRRDAMAWWISLLGDSLVCLSMLAVDESRCAGAITVTLDPGWFEQDPFARLFGGTGVETDVFCAVAPPAGPVVERYGSVPWPGGSFTR